MKFLRGKDYPKLCELCAIKLDNIADNFDKGLTPDTDDPEAPSLYMYDHNMFCGGKECTRSPRKEANDEREAQAAD